MKLVYPSDSLVTITPAALAKLMLYVSQFPGEISGIGDVTLEQNTFNIADIYLIEQECSQVETTISPKALGTFIYQRMKSHLSVVSLRLWWHSHANYDVFWSKQTDEETINTQFPGVDWLVSIVTNHRKHFLVRVDLFQPFRYTLHQVQFGIRLPATTELADTLADEITQKVTYNELPLERIFNSQS